MRLSLGASTEYDSNVFREPSDEKGDVVFRVTPQVRLVEDREQFNYSLGYMLPYEIGVKYSEIRDLNHLVSGDFRYRATPQTELFGQEAFFYVHGLYGRDQNLEDPALGEVGDGRDKVLSNNLSLGATHHFTPRLSGTLDREPGRLRHQPVQPRQRAQLRRQRQLRLPAHRAARAGRRLQLRPAELRRHREPARERHRLLQSVRILAVGVRRDDGLRDPSRPGADPLEPGGSRGDDPQPGTGPVQHGPRRDPGVRLQHLSGRRRAIRCSSTTPATPVPREPSPNPAGGRAPHSARPSADRPRLRGRRRRKASPTCASPTSRTRA